MDKKIKSKTGSKDWLYADLTATILNANMASGGNQRRQGT